jgi:ABC-type transport system substrate-binding protein
MLAIALALAATWCQAADPGKTLHAVFSIAETSFDPQFASDAASDGVISSIYESMLTYDYLVRPVKLVPRTLEAMPVIEDGGKTYVCHIRKGIFFTPDAAFKGKPRELTAADYAYGIKRLLDPGVKSPWIWLVEGKIAGSSEAIAQAAKTGRFDYAASMPGLEVVDRYTLKIRLTQPDLRFIYVLAIPNVSAVAHEVVEAYGIDFGAHPVGTGPYVLGTYNRSAKIMLDANPGFREQT